MEDCQNCSVLNCVPQLCTLIGIHQQLLQVVVGLGLVFVFTSKRVTMAKIRFIDLFYYTTSTLVEHTMQFTYSDSLTANALSVRGLIYGRPME